MISTNKAVLTVSQLNRQIKHLLEFEVGELEVEGEVSNLSKPASGHYYFTLKDAGAQLRCVFFKNRHGFGSNKTLEEGQQIVIRGKLSLYEARGDFQFIVQSWSEAGLGRLYQQFLALKEKLQTEGLFDPGRKKPLPAFPAIIAVITSATGAAIRDILITLRRRYPLAKVLVYPAEVQGQKAAGQLIAALNQAVADGRAEVLILARGGGSIEDLWSFNDEELARCIAHCPIPVVSGVGHETDFTIADFVADLRAATPTAAAEAVSPDQAELSHRLAQYGHRLLQTIRKQVQQAQLRLNLLKQKTASPRQVILSHWQTLDFLERQLLGLMKQFLRHYKSQLLLNKAKLQGYNSYLILKQGQQRLDYHRAHLLQAQKLIIRQQQQNLARLAATLQAVSPLGTLERGYAIASYQGKVVYQANQLAPGEMISVRLAEGSLDCRVERIHD